MYGFCVLRWKSFYVFQILTLLLLKKFEFIMNFIKILKLEKNTFELNFILTPGNFVSLIYDGFEILRLKKVIFYG